jgi:hypothetical protein
MPLKMGFILRGGPVKRHTYVKRLRSIPKPFSRLIKT